MDEEHAQTTAEEPSDGETAAQQRDASAAQPNAGTVSPASGGVTTSPSSAGRQKKPHTLLIAIITGIVAFFVGAGIGAYGYGCYIDYLYESAVDGIADDDEEAEEDADEEETASDEDEPELTAERTGYDWYVDGELADTALTDLLPVPSWADVDESANKVSLEGDLDSDDADEFDVYLSISSQSQFDEYKAACKEAGFDDVGGDDDGEFWADNDFGVEIDLEYEDYGDGDIELEIYVWVWDEEAYAEAVGGSYASSTSSDSSSDSSDSSDFDLIEFLDEYEDFIEEYVDFMKKYEDASYTEMATMLSDYNDMLEEYAELTETIDSYDTDDMTSEELERYLEVTEHVAELVAEL